MRMMPIKPGHDSVRSQSWDRLSVAPKLLHVFCRAVFTTRSLRDDRLVQVCEHCEESLAPDVIRSPVMNGFVRLGQRRLLVNERLLLFSPAVVLTEFSGGTSIEECELPFRTTR